MMADHDYAAANWSSEALQAMKTHLCLLHSAATSGCCAVANHHHPPAAAAAAAALELDCEMPLPDGWEQFLDIRTGQVYYVDWKNRRRSYEDPRKSPQIAAAASSSCDSYSGAAGRSEVQDGGDDDSDENCLTFPMRQEDWQLMELRGWTSSSSNSSVTTNNGAASSNYDRSQITSIHDYNLESTSAIDTGEINSSSSSPF